MKKALPLSFRLDLETKKLLDYRAAQLGQKPSSLARELLEESLDDQAQIPLLKKKINSLEKSISELRTDLATATEVLLAASGKVSPAGAKDWVEANLR